MKVKKRERVSPRKLVCGTCRCHSSHLQHGGDVWEGVSFEAVVDIDEGFALRVFLALADQQKNEPPRLGQAIKLDWDLFPREPPARCWKKSKICDYAGRPHVIFPVMRNMRTYSQFLEWSILRIALKSNLALFCLLAITANAVDSEKSLLSHNLGDTCYSVISTSNAPPYGGTSIGGGKKVCGSKVTLIARANSGFKFAGWSLEPAGAVVATNSSYSFVVNSNETFYARFADIQAPTVAITSPKAGDKVDARAFTIAGLYHDNGVIAAIYCGISRSSNSFTWILVTTNSPARWSARVILYPGTNFLAAYAVDTAGNVSRTNTVMIFNKAVGLAPESLTGLAAAWLLTGGTPLELSFGDSTFVEQSSDTNVSAGVGDYIYTVTGSNTAQLFLSYLALAELDGTTNLLSLTFSSSSEATFSSAFGSSGTLIFAPVADLAPAGLSGRTLEFNDDSNFIPFSNGLFTVDFGLGYDSLVGVYTYTKFSPNGALLQQHAINPSWVGQYDDVVMTFTSPSAGSYYFYNNDTIYPGSSITVGQFSFKPAGREATEAAPDSMSGMDIELTPDNEFPPAGQSPYALNFGDATFGSTSIAANDISGAGNYTYTRTGKDTAQLNINYLLPAWQTNLGSALELLFTNSTAGFYFNTNGFEAGGFKLSVAPHTAPLTLVGRRIRLQHQQATSTFDFAQGSYTQTIEGTQAGSGTYSFVRASDQVIMVTIASWTSLELKFSTARSGLAIFSVFGFGMLPSTTIGTFTMQ